MLRKMMVVAVVLGLATAAAADTYTWDAGGGDTNWSTGANWNNATNPDTVPGSGDDAAFGAGGGTVTVGSGDQSITNATVAGGTWTFNGSDTLNVSGTFGSSGTTAVSAKLGGAGSVAVNGSTLTLSGANSYGGGTTVNSGNLSFSSAANLGGGTPSLALNGGHVYFTGGSATTVDLSVKSGSVTTGVTLSSDKLYLGSDVTFSGDSTFYVRGNRLRAASGVEIHVDNCSLTLLNNSNTYSSSIVDVPVVLNNGNVEVTMGSYGGSRMIKLYGNISGTGNVTMLGVGGGWPTGIYGNNTFAGELISKGQTYVSGSNTGISKVRFVDGDGHRYQMILNGSNVLAPAGAASHPVAYWEWVSGTTYIFNMNDKSQTLGGLSSAANTKGAVSMGTASNTLTLNVGDGESYTYTGSVYGSGKLVKKGLGTQILTGTWSQSGGTTVQEGTIGGTGNLSGGLIANGTGHVAPGMSIGTLSTGNLTLSGDSVLDIELGDPATDGGDRINVTGTVTIADNATVEFDFWNDYYPDPAADKYFIIVNDGTDAVIGGFANVKSGRLNVAGLGAYISYEGDYDTGALTGGNDVVIYGIAPIPEPAGLSLLGLALLGLRRRRS